LANTKVSGSNISGQTLTGALGNKSISDFDAMSVDVNGNIWAGTSSNDPCLLVVLDPSTGNVKENFFGSNVDYLVVNNALYSALRFDAMAFDPVTNDLYANMNGTSQNYDYLFKINTTNGAIELVRQFNTISDVEGMAFDAVGDLYVVTGSNASSFSDDNKLWKVDLINGEVTQKYSLWGGDMETCDCILGDPITSVEVSGYVFYDTNEDTTFNTTNDVGVTGFLVNLYKDANNNGVYDAGTDQFVDSTRTYADGFYKFRLNYTSGTDKYVLVSNVSDLPSDNDYTTDNIETATFTAGRQSDENNNFGYVADNNMSVNIITGTVFADMNEDGVLQTAYEDGVAGVTVYLFEDADCDGTIDFGEAVLDSCIVSADGKYSFVQNYDTSNNTSTETITKRIKSCNDDAEEYSDGDMPRSSSDLDLGEYYVGLRFRSLNIPQGAIITEAYITFTGTETETGSNNVVICGENSDDADAFSYYDNDITDRPKASKIVNWSPGTWVNNGKYNTPNLNEIVEVIVGRSGWNSGNDMAFIIKPNGGDRDAYTYDNNSSKAALLTVVYETESTSSNNNDGKVCYNTSIDESTVPAGASMTTDNIESAEFTSGGNTDENNDFGLWGGALPVEWLSVKARWIPSGVEVRWATGSEDNNSHFVIERTHDGAHWEIIGDATGAGFSSIISNYKFTDENPYTDVNYYRIKQVDFDGQFDYSDVVMLHGMVQQSAIDITVFPNPANNNVVVEWNHKDRKSQIQVIDVNGKVVKHMELGNQFSCSLDITNVDTGIYFIQYSGDNDSKTERLVVKH